MIFNNFNEEKSPLNIFGVDINKFYESVKLFKNLPKFCDNLKQKSEITNRIKVNESSEAKNDDSNNETNKTEKIIKKVKITKLLERLTKSEKKKKKKELGNIKLDPIFRNNNLSDILPSISNSTLITDNTNHTNITNQKFFSNKYKKKIIFMNSLIKNSLKYKKENETSVFNRLSVSKMNQKKNIVKKTNNNEYIKKWNLPKVVKFNLLTGRDGESIKKSYKFKYLDEAQQIYYPNYNYIYGNNSYNVVNFSPHNKNDFNKEKFNIARKAICNYATMRNSSSETSFFLNAVNNERKKRRELRIKKFKEKYGDLFKFLNFDKNKHKLKLCLLNKNVEPL